MKIMHVIYILTLLAGFGAPFSNASTIDNWVGGHGFNWSVAGNWSSGLPGPMSDVTIYGNADVHLDTNATVNSLTLGSSAVGQSRLFFEPAQTLTTAGSLVVGQSGEAFVTGGSNSLMVGTNLTNSGYIIIGGNPLPGSVNISGTLTNSGYYVVQQYSTSNIGTLVNTGSIFIDFDGAVNLVNQSGVTDVPLTAAYVIIGKFNAGPNNAFANLTNIEGLVFLNNQTTTITPVSGVLTVASTGNLTTNSFGSTLIRGDLNNSGIVSPSFSGQLTVTGTLTNGGSIGGSFPGLVSADKIVNTGTIMAANIQATQLVNMGNISDNQFGVFVLQASELDNRGTMTGLDPGDTILVGAGSGTVCCGYYQFANGTFGEYIDKDGFGVIGFFGRGHYGGTNITLDGTLSVHLADGFAPPIGTVYQFISAPGGILTGTFDSITNDIFNNGTERWVVLYYQNSGGGAVVDLAAADIHGNTPEPSSFLLLGSGLIAAVGVARRRFFS